MNSTAQNYEKRLNNKDNLVINKLMQEVTNEVNISDEEAKEYYNNNKNQYEYSEQVNASHILLKDEEKVFDLEVGEVSNEAVKTDYGYHIIKVTDKKEAGVASFEEVKSNIKENLSNKQRQKAWEEFVNQIRDEAEIEKKLD
jgi:peptidyl-prolyl cis-trans isomerase C/foldase protein PrsA